MTRHIFNVSGDPEVTDFQVAALLVSLAEQHGKSFGPTMAFALQHAARRLCESWPDEEDDDKEGDPDDGPLDEEDDDEEDGPPAPDSFGDKTRLTPTYDAAQPVSVLSASRHFHDQTLTGRWFTRKWIHQEGITRRWSND